MLSRHVARRPVHAREGGSGDEAVRVPALHGAGGALVPATSMNRRQAVPDRCRQARAPRHAGKNDQPRKLRGGVLQGVEWPASVRQSYGVFQKNAYVIAATRCTRDVLR